MSRRIVVHCFIASLVSLAGCSASTDVPTKEGAAASTAPVPGETVADRGTAAATPAKARAPRGESSRVERVAALRRSPSLAKIPGSIRAAVLGGGVDCTTIQTSAADGTAKLVSIALDTGVVTDGAALAAGLSYANIHSMGSNAGSIYTCDDGFVTAINPADGTFNKTAAACVGVAADDTNGIWVQHAADLTLYADLASVVADTPTSTLASPSPNASRVGSGGGALVSTDVGAITGALGVDPVTGLTTPIVLNGYNDFCYGISATGDGMIAVVPTDDTLGLQLFDAAGTALGTIAPAGLDYYGGLFCTARP